MERQLEREADSCDTKSMYSSSGLDENGAVIEEWNYLNRFFKKFNKVGTNFTNSTHKWSSTVGLKIIKRAGYTRIFIGVSHTLASFRRC